MNSGLVFFNFQNPHPGPASSTPGGAAKPPNNTTNDHNNSRGAMTTTDELVRWSFSFGRIRLM